MHRTYDSVTYVAECNGGIGRHMDRFSGFYVGMA